LNGQDLPNFGFGLMFSDKLLYKRSFIFNDGWIGSRNENSIIVKAKDGRDQKKIQINKMKNVLTNMKRLFDYEILFKKKIKLRKYLIGIHCPNCDLKTQNKIKEILDNIKLNDVKIYTDGNVPII
jgi:transcription elongation factor